MTSEMKVQAAKDLEEAARELQLALMREDDWAYADAILRATVALASIERRGPKRFDA